METQGKNHSVFPKLIVTAATVVLAAGAVAAWWANNSLNSSRQVGTNSITPEATENPVKQKTVQVYWFNNDLQLVANSVNFPKTNGKEKSLEKAIKLLLTGPSDPANGTTIPRETKLLSLNFVKNSIHVDLSREFIKGGGSASMKGRLGQIIYTATSLNPNAQVWISVEGEPLKELGGEGLLVAQPMTRKLFEKYFGS